MPSSPQAAGRMPPPLPSQAERRRAQLIAIAAALIESDGMDSVTMASVAELAGCTRTQVHRYFARREDLLAAVVTDFTTRLRERLAGGDAVLTGIGESRDGSVPSGWLEALHEAMFDVFEQAGTAGLGLLVMPHAIARGNDPIAKLRAELFSPWVAFAEDAVKSPADAGIVIELWMATAYRLAARWRAGDIDRRHAVDTLTRAQNGLLRAFRKQGQS